MEMEKLLTELRDRFSKVVEEAEASVRGIEEILPEQADALRERIHKIKKSADMDINMICEEIEGIANGNGDKETIACHVMFMVDNIAGVERIPYLCQVYKFQYT